MYEPYAVLESIDEHLVPVLLLCAFTLAGAYVWFIAGIRAAARDGVYSMPVFCSLFWFAHDSAFVARFTTWFGTYDHWFMKLFWAALVVTTGIEVVYLWQTFRYGRSELAPRLSQRSYGWLLAAGIVFAIVLWAMIKAAMGDAPALGDDLFFIAFGLTIAVYPAWGIALMLRRRSVVAQSQTMWVGYSCLVLGWWSVTILYMGPAFQQWQWTLLGALALLGGLAGLLLVRAGQTRDIFNAPVPQLAG